MLTSVFPTLGPVTYVALFGDSITVGYSNQFLTVPNYQLWNGGYRLPLLQMALAENRRMVFIGNEITNSVGMNNRNHDGVSGQKIDEIKARVIALNTILVPSVVILHAGTNDFYYWQLSGTPAISAIQTRYTALVDAVFAKWPSCKIIVTTVGDWFNITGTADGIRFAAMQAQAEHATFNTYIMGLPGSHVNGANIRAVNMSAAMNASYLLGDGLHPKDDGYQRMAATFWTALRLLV